jgi:hypothetical protein
MKSDPWEFEVKCRNPTSNIYPINNTQGGPDGDPRPVPSHSLNILQINENFLRIKDDKAELLNELVTLPDIEDKFIKV